jgi:choline dehydrogenase
MDGAESLGIPRTRDYNGARQEGISYTQRSIRKGMRMSTARTYLRPALKRANLTLKTDAHATAIVFEGKRAVGIRYSRGGAHGSRQEVRASREVILSGGVVNSCQLLQLSGVGPAELLRAHAIPVVHAVAGVGENLRDHFACRFVVRVKNSSTINESARGLKLGREILNWTLGRPSILSLSPTVVYGFWRSDPTVEVSDLQFTFTPASYKEGVQSRLDDFPGMTAAAWQQRPESKGYIRIRSADPFEHPVIQPNYLADPYDRRIYLAGARLARAILTSKPMQPYFERETFPGPDKTSDDDLLAAAKERASSTFHLMGTCRMGPESDPLSVVDDQLRVRGVGGLRVVDASIMPTMLSANLNAGTIMIAEKASDMIRGRSLEDASAVAHARAS